jgi:hypothetical protein
MSSSFIASSIAYPFIIGCSLFGIVWGVWNVLLVSIRTFADTQKITSRIGWTPSIPLEEGVARMMAVIEDWRDAPLWNQSTIAEATADWFKHLGHTS